MTNLVRVAKRLIPVEQIALFEPFVPDPESPLRTARDLKARIVLLDKNSVLTEETPEQLAEAHHFRFIAADRSATNPTVQYWVETFEADETFKPNRPYLTRLSWKGPDGLARSRLLLAPPETVLAVAVRGEPDPETQLEADEPPARRAAQRRKPRLVTKEAD
jgi:hypothetical protein